MTKTVSTSTCLLRGWTREYLTLFIHFLFKYMYTLTFVMFCWFLSFNSTNQPELSTHSLAPSLPLPSPSPALRVVTERHTGSLCYTATSHQLSIQFSSLWLLNEKERGAGGGGRRRKTGRRKKRGTSKRPLLILYLGIKTSGFVTLVSSVLSSA